MYLNEYELEIIKEKLDMVQKHSKVRMFKIKQADRLMEKVEKITTELVKDFDYDKISFHLSNFPNNRLSSVNITGDIIKEGFINLDTVRMNRGTEFDNSKIILDLITYRKDDEKMKLLKEKYNCDGDGYIYL